MGTNRTMAVLAASLLVLGACGDDGGEANETGTTPTTAAPAESSTTTTTAPAEPVEVAELAVTATEFSYDLGGAPATLESGLVEVTLTNGGTEEHQAAFASLRDGATLDDLAAAPDDSAALQLLDLFGGPNAAAPGGGVSTATISLVPGDYLMMCFIPSPSDGVPHVAKGMVLPIAVTGEAGPAALPDDEVAGEITLDEFDFGLPDGFDGQGTWAIANDGEQPHEIVFYELADGATIDDAVAALAEATGPPPITPANAGLTPTNPLRASDSYLHLALAPGEYALLCFLPDLAGDGAPHFTKGMAQQLTIT